MGLFDKISNFFSSLFSSQREADWVYVRCSRCGEKIRTRIDLYTDLSAEYEGGGTTYFTRKMMMGEQGCFQKIEVELQYDQSRQLIDRQIRGGEFISEGEYSMEESQA